MDKKVLLICFSFPPNKGIGGRRWAKFAKHLAQEGYEVNVICKQAANSERSEWTQDTLSPNIKVYPLSARYPKILTGIPQSFFQKLEYRIWLLIFKLFSKGTSPERTFFWKSQLLSKASELIREKKITTVIATIPPFRIGYYTSYLKLKFPQLNLIIDYRDPWTDNSTFHGFMHLSPSRRKHELKMEVDTLNRASYVISTTEQMTNWLKAKVTDSQNKIVTIPNGFDADEILKSNQAPNTSNKTYRFIYAGTFYSNLDYILVPFLSTLKKLEEEKDFSSQFQFDFYGEMDPSMKAHFNEYNLKSINLHAPVALVEIQRIMQQSDCCMLFAAQDHAFNFNTKFYEYLANRKPIIIFSKQGEVADFLIQNKLGFAIDFNDFEANFKQCIENIKSRKVEFNLNYDLSHFSTKGLTQRLIPLLK